MLKHWSGLGFYRRAENIFKTSQIIKRNYNGIFPTKYVDLIKLPGIGRSTASAILTFSENEKLPILDGNIKRLLSRIYGINISKYNKKIDDKLWGISSKLLSNKQTSEFIQAQMDIGSLICTNNKPSCKNCPISNFCYAYKNNYFNFLKKNKINISNKFIWSIFIYNNKNEIYLEKIEQGNLWKGLYSSPLFYSKDRMIKWIKDKKLISELKTQHWVFKHKLSHINFNFNVYSCKLNRNKKISLINDNWYNLSNIEYGVPKFQEKIIDLVS